MINILKMD